MKRYSDLGVERVVFNLEFRTGGKDPAGGRRHWRADGQGERLTWPRGDRPPGTLASGGARLIRNASRPGPKTRDASRYVRKAALHHSVTGPV